MVLNKHFKIPARAIAGGFALCVNEAPQVPYFGQMVEGHLVTSAEGFHMWVQTAPQTDFLPRQAGDLMGAGAVDMFLGPNDLPEPVLATCPLPRRRSPSPIGAPPRRTASAMISLRIIGLPTTCKICTMAHVWTGEAYRPGAPVHRTAAGSTFQARRARVPRLAQWGRRFTTGRNPLDPIARRVAPSRIGCQPVCSGPQGS
jgi:hypothetical protein